MEPTFPVENRAHLSPNRFAEIAEIVNDHCSIKHAIDWCASQTPPLDEIEVVPQDEYSHDILIGYRDGLWLVYDST